MSNPKKDMVKHSQLCWECEKACGRCSWSSSFTPVPGWNAKPTKIISYTAIGGGKRKKFYVDSYEIHDCPEFELMEEIKRRIANGKPINSRLCSRYNPAVIGEIKRLRLEENLKFSEIAEIIGYDVRSVYRIFSKIREGAYDDIC